MTRTKATRKTAPEGQQSTRTRGKTRQGETPATAAPAPQGSDTTLLAVTATGDASRVGFFERHPDHPGGEVFLRGGESGRVAGTAVVADALRQGRLRKG